MRYLKIIAVPFVLTHLYSCEVSRICKSQKIYQIKDGGNDTIVTYQVEKSVNVNVKEVGNAGVEISEKKKRISTKEIKQKKLCGKVTDDFRRSIPKSSYYLPDKDVSNGAVGYMNFNLSLQAINVTFKNRCRTRGDLPRAVRDSIPSTWSSGFTPALALGYSINWNRFKVGVKKQEFSVTGGAFLGLGTVAINKEVTRMPRYRFSRSALTLNKGLFINFGFQKWDIGYAFGWECATGPGSSSWVYQKEPFHGIIIGFDIVKSR